jgi:hypothetical protein
MACFADAKMQLRFTFETAVQLAPAGACLCWAHQKQQSRLEVGFVVEA